MCETPIKPDLPEILDRCFEAQNRHDIDAMVACFASDGIRAWKKETSAKHSISAEPI